MKYTNLNQLLVLKLQSLYDVETQIIKALPQMIKKAQSDELREAFTRHLGETEAQKERLEEIFEIVNEKAKKIKVEAIRGIIADAQWLLKQDIDSEILDAALISSARHIEHYEMSGYISAVHLAELLELEDVQALLTDTLEEEEKTDDTLADLADTLSQDMPKEM